MLGVLLLAIGDFVGTGVLGIVYSTKLSCPYSPLPIGEPGLKARDGLLIRFALSPSDRVVYVCP